MTNHISRRTLCAAAAFAMSLCATGATAQDGAAEEEPFRIYGNITTIELAPVLLALDQGLFGAPATVTMGGVPNLVGEGGNSPYSEAGIADVATNAETQLLRVSVNNPNVRIVMTVSEGLYRIVANRAAGIEELSDLEGKRIGSIANTSSNFFLKEMLETAGLTMDDVELVPMWPMDTYKTALADGTVDAITIWEPGAEYAAHSIGDDAVEFSGHGVYRELFNLNTTAEALADPARRAEIVDFTAALIQASDALANDPAMAARAQELVAESASYPVEDVSGTWVHHAYPADLVPDLLDVLVKEEAWLAAATDREPRSREELATLIDDSVLEEARAKLAMD